MASFETALTLDPNCAEAYATLGHLAMQDGDAAKAEERFRVGRRLQDDDPAMLLGLGNVYLQRGEADQCGQIFVACRTDQRPDDGTVQASMGQALFEQGSYAFAEQALRNALRNRPDLRLARIYLARSLLRQDRTEAAREEFAVLLKRNEKILVRLIGLGRRSQQTRPLRTSHQILPARARR